MLMGVGIIHWVDDLPTIKLAISSALPGSHSTASHTILYAHPPQLATKHNFLLPNNNPVLGLEPRLCSVVSSQSPHLSLRRPGNPTFTVTPAEEEI